MEVTLTINEVEVFVSQMNIAELIQLTSQLSEQGFRNDLKLKSTFSSRLSNKEGSKKTRNNDSHSFHEFRQDNNHTYPKRISHLKRSVYEQGKETVLFDKMIDGVSPLTEDLF